jgi:hypothetical protein
MKKLEDIVFPKGTGITDLSAKLIKREGRVCMYERIDDVWEVFIVQTRKACIIKGVSYPAHEEYPGNEDFGNTAWCFTNLENAERRFKSLVESRYRVIVKDTTGSMPEGSQNSTSH